jgi:hypothetical protein
MSEQLRVLAHDVYHGTIKKYSVEEGNDAIRKAINEACGGEFSYYSYLDNRGKVFKVLSEVLTVAMGEPLTSQMDEFVEVIDVPLGDTKEFIIENQDLFRVAEIANGSQDLRRQRIFDSKIKVETSKLGIKLYTDLDLFMANRIKWDALCDRVIRSYEVEIGKRKLEAIMSAYDGLSAPYQISGTYSEDKLHDAIAHVMAETGAPSCVIYGTRKALSKITQAVVSEKKKEEFASMGHYGSFYDTEMRVLPQFHKYGTTEFLVDDNFLMILPNDGKSLVKVILEGEVQVYESNANARNDQQIEYYFGRRVGICVLKANEYAMWKMA